VITTAIVTPLLPRRGITVPVSVIVSDSDIFF
jgi:hypothetical protein